MPSRNSWMSGIYPLKLGMQRGVIIPGTNECAPLSPEFFPQKLQKLGYSTHMVGKWHLGFCSWNCTPLYRGFDSFYGFYDGQEDYYTKVVGTGIDFTTEINLWMLLSLSVCRQREIYYKPPQEIKASIFIPSVPVRPHSGWGSQTLRRGVSKTLKYKCRQRRQYCGMVSAIDESIANVTRTLVENNLIDNTLIIIILLTSDNGI